MAETINPLLNPITAQDPEYLRKALQLQRRQQLAQTLQPMALSPIDYNLQGRISPLQGMSKMANAYIASKLSNDNIDQQAKLQSQAAQTMAQAYGATPGATGLPAATAGGATPSTTALANALAPAPESTQPPKAAPQPQPTPQLPGQQFGGSATPLNPYGLPPMLVLMASQGDPGAKAQVEALLKARELTGEQKNSRDPTIGAAFRDNLETGNMTPLQKLLRAQSQVPQGSPQWDALQAAIQKEGALPVKQGELVMYGNKPLAYNPETDNGMVPQFGNVNGAMMPTGAQALPGYAQGSASIAGAEQGAKTANSVYTGVQTPGGGTVSGYGSALFGPGAQGGQQPQPKPQQGAGIGPGYAGGSAQAAAPGQREILMQELASAQARGNQGDVAALQRELARLPGGVPQGVGAGRGQAMQQPQQQGAPGVISGSGTSDVEINKNAGQVLAQLPQAVQQSMQVRRSLENALQSLQGTKTGPGTAGAFSLAAMLQNLGLPVAKEPTANYQTLTKYLNNSLSTASAIHGSNGSDARMEQFSHGQPNADTMNKGPLEQAIRYVLSQNDAVGAANQVIGSEYQRLQAAGDPRAAYNAQQAWIKQYDPKVFEFNRMGPAERKAMVDSMTAEQRKAFGDKYNVFNARGWVQ